MPSDLLLRVPNKAGQADLLVQSFRLFLADLQLPLLTFKQRLRDSQPMKNPRDIAKEIIDDLLDRAGIQEALEACDEDTRTEILNAITVIIDDGTQSDGESEHGR